MKDILNAAVKFREEFRPFAPSVVVEEARRFFEIDRPAPLVVNTSFNIKGQPIVCTPEDALGTFFTSGLDVLAIGDFLVEK